MISIPIYRYWRYINDFFIYQPTSINYCQLGTIAQQYGDWYTGPWWVQCNIWYSNERRLCSSRGQTLASRRPEAKLLWPWSQRSRIWRWDAPRPNFYGLDLKVQALALRHPEAKFLWPWSQRSRPWPWDASMPNFYGLDLKGAGLGRETPRGHIFMALVSKVQALALRRLEAKLLWPWSQRSRSWPWDASRPNFYGLGLKGPGLGLETPRCQIFMALIQRSRPWPWQLHWQFFGITIKLKAQQLPLNVKSYNKK